MNPKLLKILSYIFFPVTLIVIAIKIYMSFNKNKSNTELKEVNEADHKLEIQEEKTKTEADMHEKKADELEKEADKPVEDKDWYKK